MSYKLIDQFASRQCVFCVRDAGYRDELSGDAGCPILLEAILTVDFPPEWDGLSCDEFEPEGV